MHRDEAIYARADARAGIMLTAEEAGMAASWYRTHPEGGLFPPADDALAARLEAASTTSPS